MPRDFAPGCQYLPLLPLPAEPQMWQVWEGLQCQGLLRAICCSALSLPLPAGSRRWQVCNCLQHRGQLRSCHVLVSPPPQPAGQT